MIWKSVVGKLWLTIIGLVSVVLIILVLLLVQFLDQFYEQQNDRSLTLLSQRLATMIENYGNEDDDLEARRHVIEMARDLLPAYDTQMVVLKAAPDGESYVPFSPTEEQHDIPLGQLLKRSDIKKVFEGEEQKVRGTLNVEMEVNGETTDVPLFTQEVLAVAEPIHGKTGVIGAIVVYQSLSQLEQTTQRTKELVFYAALVGIFMTTIFAFFLSSRVTQPLVQMKQAADKMAEGYFNVRVPIRTTDEIGELSEKFNYMSARLDESIHELSQEKEQLSSVLGSMTDAVITVDAKGNVIITNPPAERLLLESEAEGEERGENDKVLPQPLADSFKRVVETEQEEITDLLIHGHTWAVVMTPLYAREQVRGAVAVLRDVTEERRLDKLREDFVANVSHELRTPLVMLQGYSEALLDDIAQSPEDSEELVRIIHDESLRMGRLLEELLDLARLEAGSVRIEPKETVVQRLGERVVRKFQGLAQEAGVTLEGTFPEAPLHGRIDEDGMEQVLTNLIDNAIRHTPKGGTVTLAMEKAADGVVMKVCDTGSGIPAEDVPFIFERFYKADKARTRSRSGTGLGLSIAKHIVEEHDGTITVKSREGEGTVFTIHLPD